MQGLSRWLFRPGGGSAPPATILIRLQKFPEVFSSVNGVAYSKSPGISVVGGQSRRTYTVQEVAKSVFWNPVFFLAKWLTGNC